MRTALVVLECKILTPSNFYACLLIVSISKKKSVTKKIGLKYEPPQQPFLQIKTKIRCFVTPVKKRFEDANMSLVSRSLAVTRRFGTTAARRGFEGVPPVGEVSAALEKRRRKNFVALKCYLAMNHFLC